MNNCEKYQELISRMIDGDLTAGEKAELEAHIAVCPECQRLYDAFLAVSNSISEDLAQPPSNMKDNIMAEISTKAGKITPFRRWRTTLAAAACLALVLFGASKAGLFGETQGLANLGGLGSTPATQSQQADGSLGTSAAKTSLEEPLATLNISGTDYTISDDLVYAELWALITPPADAVTTAQTAANPALDTAEYEYLITLADGSVIEITVADNSLYCCDGEGSEYLAAGPAEQLTAFVDKLSE